MISNSKASGSEKQERGSESEKKQVVAPLCRATVLALAQVYCYRLPSVSSRRSYWMMISDVVSAEGGAAKRICWDKLSNEGFPSSIVLKAQQNFVSNLEIEPGIALNQALSENLFVTIVCILNKIPIFIVGKPGTSKTLAIQIIASNLQGRLSPCPLWRQFPAVYIFQYQCSPLSTAASINFQFEAAKSYQEQSQDVSLH
jgi:hypothetical protein